MKKFLLPLLLLTGCLYISNDHYPQVELPDNISGTFVQCAGDLECQRNCVGVCKNGYWIAEYVSSATPPHKQTGIVIVCGKSPSQQ